MSSIKSDAAFMNMKKNWISMWCTEQERKKEEKRKLRIENTRLNKEREEKIENKRKQEKLKKKESENKKRAERYRRRDQEKQ